MHVERWRSFVAVPDSGCYLWERKIFMSFKFRIPDKRSIVTPASELASERTNDITSRGRTYIGCPTVVQACAFYTIFFISVCIAVPGYFAWLNNISVFRSRSSKSSILSRKYWTLAAVTEGQAQILHYCKLSLKYRGFRYINFHFYLPW